MVVVITCVGNHYSSPSSPFYHPTHPSRSPPPHSLSHTPPSSSRLQPNQRLQRRVLLSRAVQEKMAAVSRSCLHICQELTVQEKMGSMVCCFFWVFFYIIVFKTVCVGDCCFLGSLCFTILAFKAMFSDIISSDFMWRFDYLHGCLVSCEGRKVL